MELKDLYREVILDHNRSPRNFGRLDPADAAADGHNPLCGDQLHVSLRLQGDRLADLRFEGRGCAISVASASLMSEAVKGRSRDEVEALYQRVHALLTGNASGNGGGSGSNGVGVAPAEAADLGKLAALAGVAEFPARVKCASLCWHTLHAALAQSAEPSDAAQPVSTE